MILQAAAGAAISKIGTVVALAAVVFAGAWGISRIGRSALDAGARQPEQASEYRMTALIIAALVEGACLFGILVCLIALN